MKGFPAATVSPSPPTKPSEEGEPSVTSTSMLILAHSAEGPIRSTLSRSSGKPHIKSWTRARDSTTAVFPDPFWPYIPITLEPKGLSLKLITPLATFFTFESFMERIRIMKSSLNTIHIFIYRKTDIKSRLELLKTGKTL